MVAGIRIVLQKVKRATGEYPICLRVIQHRKAYFIGLGVTSLLKDWDAAKGLPKKSHPLHKELVVKLETIKLEASKLQLAGIVITDRNQLEKLADKPPERYGVIAYGQQTVSRLKTENRHGYANTFKDTLSSLSKQLTGNRQDFLFEEITPQLLRQWESKLKQEDCKPGTISLYFRTLRVLINYARLEKITSHSPFMGDESFSMTKYGRIQTPKRAISKQQIDLIRQLDLAPESPGFHTRQFFLFSFYTKGMNFSDIAYLTPDSLDGNYIQYQRKKTHKWQRIYLLEPARVIWNYYLSTMKVDQKTVFWFILGPTHQTVQQQDYRLERVNRQLNTELRKIGKLVGIQQHLTTYVARHSFASVLKAEGVPTDQISELMGHDSVLTTKIYLQNFEQEQLDQAVQKLL